MEIKKTVGHPKLDYYINGKNKKGYIIHTTCGEKYQAKPVGSKTYECGGLKFKSIKELKAHIVEGGFDSEAPDERSTLDGDDTWDCAHPCALLISYWLKGHPGYLYPEVKATLDSYGWLDESGQPDFDRADKEIERVNRIMRLKNGN